MKNLRRLSLPLAAAALLVASPAQAAKPDPAACAQHIDAGNKAMGNRDLPGAIAAYEKASKADPTRADAFGRLGNAAVMLAAQGSGKFGPGLAAFEQCLKLNPKEGPCLHGYSAGLDAQLELKFKQTSQAPTAAEAQKCVVAYDAFIAANPPGLDPMIAKAKERRAKLALLAGPLPGDVNPAKADEAKAQQLFGDARRKFEAGQYDAAYALYEQVLAANQKHGNKSGLSDALEAMALCKEKLQKFSEAKALCQRSIAEGDAGVVAYFTLGKISFNEDRNAAETIRWATEGLKKFPGNPQLLKIKGYGEGR